MSSALTVARMSYGAAVVGMITYGVYFALVCICFHFLWKGRRKPGASRRVLSAYTSAMFITTTIYFVSATAWSKQEFVESTVNPGVFATLTSGHLAISKDVSICVNMWLADSLILYRVYVVWGRRVALVVIPILIYLTSLGSGIALCIASARPNAGFGAKGVTVWGTTYWSLTVSLNIICTSLIAARLLYHQHRVRSLKLTAQYMGIITILVESAALYSVSGLIYIPLFARNIPLQFPFAALFCGASSIAPNFIVLRMALGTAVSSPSKATLPFLTTSVHRRTNIAFAANPESGFTDMSRTATNPSAIRSYKGNTTTALDVTDEEVYPMEILDNGKLNSTSSIQAPT